MVASIFLPISNMKKIMHKLTFHWFGLAGGKIATWWGGNSVWVGFRCGCGELLDAHRSY